MEAWVGIEPTIQVLQTRALPFGDHAVVLNGAIVARNETVVEM
jgi:hypothetical protein